MIHRIKNIFAIFLIGLFSIAPLSSYAQELEDIMNLKSLADKHPDDVIILLISQEDCGFCFTVKEDFLIPLSLSKQAPPIGVLNLSYEDKIIDFNGNYRYVGEIANEIGGRFAPTVLFVDSEGNQLAESIVGINTPEFYGYYIDRAIEIARNRLKI